MDERAEGHSGDGSLHSELILTTVCRADDVSHVSREHIENTGLNFVEAVMVSFNSGLGPALSVVAYAASLSGYVGFVFCPFDCKSYSHPGATDLDESLYGGPCDRLSADVPADPHLGQAHDCLEFLDLLLGFGWLLL